MPREAPQFTRQNKKLKEPSNLSFQGLSLGLVIHNMGDDIGLGLNPAREVASRLVVSGFTGSWEVLSGSWHLQSFKYKFEMNFFPPRVSLSPMVGCGFQ